ncbi:hypothetical protein [Nocardia crassostreae]|uniref:hypothetical protein n=1 Tax=Nocardia crassostreae TaxID=53428 RepID=UPI00082A4A61|nr:hypothetical protein [Nocardia crassostreae]
MAIEFQWTYGADAADCYAEELMPGHTAADGIDDPDLDMLGAVCARRAGELLGFAELHASSPTAAWVQAAYAPRIIRAMVAGYYDMAPATAEETDIIGGLIRQCADHARSEGYTVLRWEGQNTGPEGRAAIALDARTTAEYARTWTAAPTDWQAPQSLPPLEPVSTLADTGDGPEDTPLELTVDTAAASVRAAIMDTDAYVNIGESLSHPADMDPATLAALFGALVVELRRQAPHVELLTVIEFEDETARTALELSGLTLAGRFENYELPLTA